MRLIADDIDWTRGDGALIQGSMGALLLLLTGRLLLLTGRKNTVGELGGDGVARLGST